MTYKHICKGTCSSQVTLTIDKGIVTNVQFQGGCSGNLQGVAALVEGMRAEDVISKLKGIRCGFKSTSCPDQLAAAVSEAVGQNIETGETYVLR